MSLAAKHNNDAFKVGGPSRAAVAAVHAVLRRLAGLGGAVIRVRALERQRSALLHMSERQRKDIGISRWDALAEAKRIRRREMRLLCQALRGSDADSKSMNEGWRM